MSARLDPNDGVELVYKAAEAIHAAYRAVNIIPFGARPALDILLDGPVFPGDLDALAKKLKAMADEWDADIAAAEEARDRAAMVNVGGHRDGGSAS